MISHVDSASIRVARSRGHDRATLRARLERLTSPSLFATCGGAAKLGETVLGRPWMLVAAVALVVALPILVLGQASENETRARLQAAQLESASRSAGVIASSFDDRLGLIRATLVTLTQNPRPDASAVAL